MADYIEHLKKAIAYIEENLTRLITLEDISKAAGLSPFHFTRTFHRLIGETLSSYIRKRRLTEASKELMENRFGILDIALKFQFQSQASFTKAFKRQFNTTPGKIRELSSVLKLGEVKILAPENLVHRVEGGTSLEPRVKQCGPIKLAGMKCANTLEEVNVPGLWQQFLPQVGKIENSTGSGIYGVSIYDSRFLTLDAVNEFRFDYLVGCPVSTLANIPDGMVGYEIPARKYAIFTHRGYIREMPNTYDYIYKTWLPASGREFIFVEHFEFWDVGYKGDFEDSEVYIYIPLGE